MNDSTGAITTHDHVSAIREWFSRLSTACAAVDYAAGERIFAQDVASFGTRADIVIGLELLRANQWEGIWPNIADFQIDLDSVQGGGDGDTAWGVAVWNSTGFYENGHPFDRPGRSTVVLERRKTESNPRGEWMAVHTHFSLNPGTPARTFGEQSVSTHSGSRSAARRKE